MTLPGTAARVPREEDRRRILDLAKALLAHHEEAHLVRGAETILDGAHDSEPAAEIALEIQHGVDHVLEHARPRERALLRHVADEQRRHVVRLRVAHELRRALAHLTHGARRRLQLLAEQRLDRIDREHAELFAGADASQDRLDTRLGQELERHLADAQALRAQPDLVERLLARHVATRDARREIRERAQQQRRLADSRVTAEQHDAARHEPAAEHAVELAEPGAERARRERRRRDPAS